MPETQTQPHPRADAIIEQGELGPASSPFTLADCEGAPRSQASATTSESVALPSLRNAQLPSDDHDKVGWKPVVAFSAVLAVATAVDLSLKALGKPEIGGHLGAALGDNGTGSSAASIRLIQQRLEQEKAAAAKDTRPWWQKIPALSHFGR